MNSPTCTRARGRAAGADHHGHVWAGESVPDSRYLRLLSERVWAFRGGGVGAPPPNRPNGGGDRVIPRPAGGPARRMSQAKKDFEGRDLKHGVFLGAVADPTSVDWGRKEVERQPVAGQAALQAIVLSIATSCSTEGGGGIPVAGAA